MKKIMIFFSAFLILGFISCRTTKNTEKTTIQKIVLDSTHTLYDDEDITIDIEYPISVGFNCNNHENPGTIDDNSNFNPSPSSSKKPNLKPTLKNLPLVSGMKIKYQHTKKRTISDSIHKDIDSKDDNQTSSSKPTTPFCQYGAFLAIFILFFCLVVAFAKKHKKKFGDMNNLS